MDPSRPHHAPTLPQPYTSHRRPSGPGLRPASGDDGRVGEVSERQTEREEGDGMEKTEGDNRGRTDRTRETRMGFLKENNKNKKIITKNPIQKIVNNNKRLER